MPILRSILGIFVGLVTAFMCVAAGDMLSGLIASAPPGLDFNDDAARRTFVENMPVSALVVMLAGHGFGTFAGGLVAALIAGRARFIHAGAVGVLVLMAGLANDLWLVPFHPLWFVLADMLVYVPPALLGAQLAATRSRAGAGK